MGLCFSINRQYYYLKRYANNVSKRTFKAQTLLVRLHQIVDGDTFHIITKLNSNEPLHQYSLRLIGLDTPEMKPHLSNPMHDLHREAAIYVRDQLRALYPVGTIFIVDFDNEDKYGRLLGKIWTIKRGFLGLGRLCKDKDVCQLILARGWAIAYNGGKKVEFTQQQLLKIINQI